MQEIPLSKEALIDAQGAIAILNDAHDIFERMVEKATKRQSCNGARFDAITMPQFFGAARATEAISMLAGVYYSQYGNPLQLGMLYGFQIGKQAFQKRSLRQFFSRTTEAVETMVLATAQEPFETVFEFHTHPLVSHYFTPEHYAPEPYKEIAMKHFSLGYFALLGVTFSELTSFDTQYETDLRAIEYVGELISAEFENDVVLEA